TLAYDANGGSGEMQPASAAEGESVAAAACGFGAPGGKEFAGWNAAADGSGAAYAEGDPVELSADTVLYAQWRDAELPPAQTFALSYDANGGAGEMQPAAVEAGKPIAVAECGFTAPADKVFSGWNEAADGSGAAYAAGDPITLEADAVLYAQWADDPAAVARRVAQQQADAFAALARGIGAVDLSAAGRIAEARAAYDALPDAARALVAAEDLALLESAEAQLARCYYVTLSYEPVASGSTAELLASTNAPEEAIGWQISTDEGIIWDDVEGAVGVAYSVPTVEGSLGNYYRAKATIPLPGRPDYVTYSNAVMLAAVVPGPDPQPDPDPGPQPDPDPQPDDGTAAQQAATNKKAAASAASAIAKLPDVANVTDADAKAVAAARAAYDALTSAQKKLVPAATLKKLAAAEAAVKSTITFNAAKCTKAALAKAVKKSGKKPAAVKKVVLGTKVKRIAKASFAKLKKAKTIVVQTKKLKKAAIAKALAKSKVAAVVVNVGNAKANKAYAKKYKKIFTKKICGKKVSVRAAS
ncbi:MAG TPA: hypothetical protein DCP91_13645, partial [Eggerthellaceae bacterium]|nr:hypothetical protein [Eggerthellaceae bacterium]